ncbi:cytochrome c-type biogenesis protein [Allohahella marinimesophila]|uniref:Cytochrome c-type biogenesis protein n=1 Tax=Allohahella marinimesophila TaxID=1054972 RepID=A0ABP7NN23_9GAMM
MTRLLRTLMMLMVMSLSGHLPAAIYEFSSPELQERFEELVYELRCPKCQNQNIADSNSPLASDLRDEVQRLLEDGYSDEAIRNHMTDRYGEFVLYKPQVNERTAILWFGPAAAVLTALIGLFWWLRVKARRDHVAAEAAPQVDEMDEQRLAELKRQAADYEVRRD